MEREADPVILIWRDLCENLTVPTNDIIPLLPLIKKTTVDNKLDEKRFAFHNLHTEVWIPITTYDLIWLVVKSEFRSTPYMLFSQL